MKNDKLDSVKKVLETFLEGTKRLDYAMMTSVVHPDARLFLGEESESKRLYDHWKDCSTFTKEEKKNYFDSFLSAILSVEVEGTIARAKLRMNNWVDFLTLIKINDDWKIVVKVSHEAIAY